ncbi:MAG: hypothetical protein LBE48_01345 [Methanomassiliicoccaceae archaeon]|jgi:cell wall assembly regulator SMI1|nr:hypothetical protein [Methanomassiliicoccaceae archaeon]
METKERYAKYMRSDVHNIGALFDSATSKDLTAIYEHHGIELPEDMRDKAEVRDGNSVTSMIYSMMATFLIVILMIKKRKDDEDMIRRIR